jgi:hypothetical protein
MPFRAKLCLKKHMFWSLSDIGLLTYLIHGRKWNLEIESEREIDL